MEWNTLDTMFFGPRSDPFGEVLDTSSLATADAQFLLQPVDPHWLKQGQGHLLRLDWIWVATGF